MAAEATHTQPKVLMIGAHQLVLDNVRVLLSTMGCQCVICLTLKQALALLEKEKPDAAIVDGKCCSFPRSKSFWPCTKLS